ncbi:MAG: hypothetical protein QOD96_3202, partial [Pseudonocardiales bacterium]|nr:hypothetical protein [Pseudonocardiales bacterium]
MARESDQAPDCREGARHGVTAVPVRLLGCGTGTQPMSSRV